MKLRRGAVPGTAPFQVSLEPAGSDARIDPQYALLFLGRGDEGIAPYKLPIGSWNVGGIAPPVTTAILARRYNERFGVRNRAFLKNRGNLAFGKKNMKLWVEFSEKM